MTRRNPFFLPAVLSLPLAALAAVSSLAGILLPGTYARETAVWAAQAVGGDWVNLFVFVPVLVVAAALTLKGSRLFTLLLGGVLLYSAYTFVIFAFAVHFNRLFLVYCAEVGLTFYALFGLLFALRETDVRAWFSPRTPVRVAGVFLVLYSAIFYVVWLSEVIPAVVAGAAPKSVTEAGLLTNPVHVLDLAVVLPALLAAGVALIRRRSFGYYFASIALSFTILMALAIAGMVVVLVRLNPATDLAVAWIFGAIMLVAIAVLWAFLAHLQPVPGADRVRA